MCLIVSESAVGSNNSGEDKSIMLGDKMKRLNSRFTRGIGLKVAIADIRHLLTRYITSKHAMGGCSGAVGSGELLDEPRGGLNGVVYVNG